MLVAEIVELDPEDERSWRITSSGDRVIRGATLAKVMERLGGNMRGEITNPVTGEVTIVDLSRWDGRDASRTYIQVRLPMTDRDALRQFERVHGRIEFLEQLRRAGIEVEDT